KTSGAFGRSSSPLPSFRGLSHGRRIGPLESPTDVPAGPARGPPEESAREPRSADEKPRPGAGRRRNSGRAGRGTNQRARAGQPERRIASSARKVEATRSRPGDTDFGPWVLGSFGYSDRMDLDADGHADRRNSKRLLSPGGRPMNMVETTQLAE